MKRKLTRALALVLILCMAMTQMAFAATTYYVTVSITGPNANGETRTVSAETSHYGTLSTPLAAEIVTLVHDKRSELATEFAGTGLSQKLDAGVEAFKNDADWKAYVDANIGDVEGDLKTVLADKTSTFSALTENQAYLLTYSGYTVTITLKSYTTGNGGTVTPPAPQPSVIVKDGSNGSAVANPSTPSKGDTVTIVTTPADGYVSSRVIVVDENGNRIPATYLGNGRYSFVMPDGTVTVTPEFRRAAAKPAETGVDQLLNVEDHVAYMVGDTKGNFRPKDSITRAEVAQVFYRLLKNQNVEITKHFDDVKAGVWYTKAVETLASAGIINGKTETSFEPDRTITRAEFVAICARFAKEATGNIRFSDVPETYWAYNYITAAAEYGWVLGDGTGKFNPTAPITRAEAAAIINRMTARLGDLDAMDNGQGKRFPDVSSDYWAFYDITEAASGHDHSFDAEGIHEAWAVI